MMNKFDAHIDPITSLLKYKQSEIIRKASEVGVSLQSEEEENAEQHFPQCLTKSINALTASKQNLQPNSKIRARLFQLKIFFKKKGAALQNVIIHKNETDVVREVPKTLTQVVEKIYYLESLLQKWNTVQTQYQALTSALNCSTYVCHQIDEVLNVCLEEKPLLRDKLNDTQIMQKIKEWDLCILWIDVMKHIGVVSWKQRLSNTSHNQYIHHRDQYKKLHAELVRAARSEKTVNLLLHALSSPYTEVIPVGLVEMVIRGKNKKNVLNIIASELSYACGEKQSKIQAIFNEIAEEYSSQQNDWTHIYAPQGPEGSLGKLNQLIHKYQKVRGVEENLQACRRIQHQLCSKHVSVREHIARFWRLGVVGLGND